MSTNAPAIYHPEWKAVTMEEWNASGIVRVDAFDELDGWKATLPTYTMAVMVLGGVGIGWLD